MVGLEASLHTSVGDEISQLRKNDKEIDGDIEFDDEPTPLNAEEDFDASELLASPLFNNSTNKLSDSFGNDDSFGTFHEEITENTTRAQVQQSQPSCSASGGYNPSDGGDFAQHRSYDVLKQQPARLYNSPSRTTSAESAYSQVSYDSQPPTHGSVGSPQMGSYQPNDGQGLASGMNSYVASQQQMSPSKVPPGRTQSMPLTSSSFQRGIQFQQQAMANQYQQQQEQLLQQDNFVGQGEQMSMQMQQSGSSYPMQGSPSRSASYCSPRQGGRSFVNQPPATAPGYGQLQSSSQHGSSSYSSPNRNGSYSNIPPQNIRAMNDLQRMQMSVQGMNHSNGSLSQTVHGEPFRRTSGMMDQQSLSHSMHDQRSNSFRGLPSSGSPSFAMMPAHSNVSIATPDMHGRKEMDMSTSSAVNGNGPLSANEAMEKLCESMKRSAMSRSLIKQFSGRNLSRQNSGRLVTRGVMRASSARSLADDGSGRGTPSAAVPIRRISNTKHHLQHPTRGVYRHDSQQSLNSQSNHGISLHLDGRNMGAL